MSGRIEKTFARLKNENRAAFIPFIMGYDPDAKTTAALLDTLPGQGADIIEIGMPFSDPMADGPVIQAAGKRALAAGATVKKILDTITIFRKKNNETPIILMGYFNPVYRYGSEKFCHDAVAAGVDGIIIVDLPPEEEDEIKPYLQKSGLKLIRLIAPTSDGDRLKILSQSATGFIYYISVAGITGAKTAETGSLKIRIDHLRRYTTLPVAVGFGIKTVQQVREFSPFSDAIVVGSALVDIISRQKDSAAAVASAGRFVTELAAGLKRD